MYLKLYPLFILPYLKLYSLFILLYLKLYSFFILLFPFFYVVRVHYISIQFLKALNQMASISNELTTLLQAGKECISLLNRWQFCSLIHFIITLFLKKIFPCIEGRKSAILVICCFPREGGKKKRKATWLSFRTNLGEKKFFCLTWNILTFISLRWFCIHAKDAPFTYSGLTFLEKSGCVR